MSVFLLMRFLYFFAWLYIAWRINAGLKIRKPHSRYVYLFFILLAVFSIISFILLRNGISLPYMISLFGDIIMGVCGITVTFFIVNEILNALNILFKIKKFRYYSTLTALVLSALGCAWALINAAFILNVKEIKIKVPELPVDSFKIALLSDIHINNHTSAKTIKKIFTMTEALKPDLIAMIGDIIDADINKDDKFRDYGFEILQAPYGIFAVTGNHERRRLDAYYEMCEKLGIKVLKNENVLAGGIINIAGINDSGWRDAELIKSVFSAFEKENFVLFLSHRPETFDIAAEQDKRIIQLSGHTHAGQIPPIEIARKLMKYNYGLYSKDKSVMYITSGIRWWGPPMRFGNTGEIAVIILEKDAK